MRSSGVRCVRKKTSLPGEGCMKVMLLKESNVSVGVTRQRKPLGKRQ